MHVVAYAVESKARPRVQSEQRGESCTGCGKEPGCRGWLEEAIPVEMIQKEPPGR